MISKAYFDAAQVVTSSGSTWANPIWACSQDTRYATTATISAEGVSRILELKGPTYDIDIPVDATILSVKANIHAKASSSAVMRVSTLNWVVNSVADTANNAKPLLWEETESTYIYPDKSDIAWTPAILSADSTGLQMIVTCDLGSNATASVNFVELEVEWEAATVPSTTTTDDLCTLAQVKTYLGANSYTDAQIEAAINAASIGIANYCDRILSSVDKCEWVKLSGSNAVNLSTYPIIRLRRVAIGGKESVRLTFSNSSAVSATATVNAGVLTISDAVPGSARKGYADFTLASYSSMATLKTAIEASTDIDTGWTVQVIAEDKPTSLAPTSETINGSGTISLYAPNLAISANLDTVSGLITLPGLINYPDWVWTDSKPYIPSGCEYDTSLTGYCYKPTNWVYVEYTAGYESIPYDLQQIAIEAAVNILDSSKLTNGVTSEKLGDASVNYGQGRTISDDIKARLAPYRRLGF